MQLEQIREKNKINAYKQLEQKNPFQQVLWAGIMGNSENLAFEHLMAETIEVNSGYQSTRRSIALRNILLNLGKLDWTFRYFQKLFQRLEDPSLYNQFSYLRALVFDSFENWSGARALARLVCLGGVRKDLKLGDQKNLSMSLEVIKKEFSNTLEHCLFDFVVKENLTDLAEHLNESQMDKIHSWPGSFNSLDLQRIEKLENLLTKELFARLVAEQSSGAYENIFWELYCSRMVSILESIDEASELLEQLPEGDFRIKVDHLHIPGNHFVCRSIDSPSGRVYSYYCSGKIRFRSYSTYIFGLLDDDLLSLGDKENILMDVLGLDPIQGALCEDAN